MGRPPINLSRAGLWQETVVADFMRRHPDGMFRPVDADADPKTRIEAMPWWETRPALILLGCSGSEWNEARLVVWGKALAAAAEARGAVVEIACGSEGADAEIDFAKLGSGYRWRRRPDKPLGPISTLRGMGASSHPALSYFHVVHDPVALHAAAPRQAIKTLTSPGRPKPQSNQAGIA